MAAPGDDLHFLTPENRTRTQSEAPAAPVYTAAHLYLLWQSTPRWTIVVRVNHTVTTDSDLRARRQWH